MAHFRTGQPVQVHHQKPWIEGQPIKLRGTAAFFDGFRLMVDRQFKSPGQAYDGLGATQRPGDYGTIELRKEAWISRRRYLRTNGDLIGELYNIQTPTVFLPDMALYVDLEIDVAYLPNGRERVRIQDEKELEAAVRWGFIPPELAGIAARLAEELAGRLRHSNHRPEPNWDIRPREDEAAPQLAALAVRWPGTLKAPRAGAA